MNRNNRGLAAACCIGAMGALLLASCSSGGPSNPGAGGQPSAGGGTTIGGGAGSVTVGFVLADSADPYFGQMKCGATDAAKKSNVKLLYQGTTSLDPSDEMQVLNAVIAKKPQGMVLDPFDGTSFIAPVQKLMSQNIPVVTVDGTLNKKVEIQNISTDNAVAGAAAAKEMAKLIHGKGTVGILTAPPGNAAQSARYTGFAQGMKKYAPNVELLPPQYVNNDTSKAATAVTAWLQAHPDLSGVYATAAPDAPGATSAVQAAHKTGSVKIVSYDTEPNQVAALKKGDVDALVGQSPYAEGFDSVTLVAQILRHQVDRASIPYQKHAPFLLITRKNVDSPQAKKYLYTNC